jgi:hypothetical protein
MTSTNCFRNCNTVVNAKSLFFPRLFSRSKTTLDTVKHQFRFKPVFRRRQALIGDKEAPSWMEWGKKGVMYLFSKILNGFRKMVECRDYCGKTCVIEAGASPDRNRDKLSVQSPATSVAGGTAPIQSRARKLEKELKEFKNKWCMLVYLSIYLDLHIYLSNTYTPTHTQTHIDSHTHINIDLSGNLLHVSYFYKWHAENDRRRQGNGDHSSTIHRPVVAPAEDPTS